MKKLGANQQAIKLFDEVFIKGSLHDQIHIFGDYGLFLTYRNVPDFESREIIKKPYIIIQKISHSPLSICEVYKTFYAFINDFQKPLTYMNKHDKSFRSDFIKYANNKLFDSKLTKKADNNSTKRSKI
ncbi:hypothetical protein KTD15_06360 [Burkholderia multivorans]|uniref:hypothetical protein n=1 Tax=Burkholderia multivorans TaxID=87883 RepID=UPI001C23BCD5|nr:hypothetical protein [Burkholderia multivorans]MBU9118417.1 hypothetical protein [Burkholderia multivorans]